MKVIDLLNKIANGNDMPLSFKYEDIIWVLKGERYYQEKNDDIELEEWFEKCLFISLNDEIEIIEKEKDIEKINNAYYHENQDRINEIFKIKINELIDIVKELKNEKENN
jgi:hypothetical protein